MKKIWTILIFSLSVMIMNNSCNENDIFESGITEPDVTLKLKSSDIIALKTLAGNPEGPIEQGKEDLLKNRILSHIPLSETSLYNEDLSITFKGGTDSISIPGYINSPTSTILFNNTPHVFHYKFENNYLMIWNHYTDEWINFGYGTKEWIIITLEHKYIFHNIDVVYPPAGDEKNYTDENTYVYKYESNLKNNTKSEDLQEQDWKKFFPLRSGDQNMDKLYYENINDEDLSCAWYLKELVLEK